MSGTRCPPLPYCVHPVSIGCESYQPPPDAQVTINTVSDQYAELDSACTTLVIHAGPPLDPCTSVLFSTPVRYVTCGSVPFCTIVKKSDGLGSKLTGPVHLSGFPAGIHRL